MDEFQCHFGQLAKQVMMQQGLSVKTLCAKLNKHNTVVYYWLRSQYWPTDRVELVSAALGENLFALATPPGQHPAVQELTEELERLKKDNQRLEELAAALRKQ